MNVDWTHAGMKVGLLLSKSTRGHEGNGMQRTEHLSTGQDRDRTESQEESASVQPLRARLLFLLDRSFTLYPEPAVIPALAPSGCGRFHIPYPGSATSVGAELPCVWTLEADPAWQV